jgi:hypothetical protein
VRKNRVERPASYEYFGEYRDAKEMEIFYERVIASMQNMYNDDNNEIPELVETDDDDDYENNKHSNKLNF